MSKVMNVPEGWNLFCLKDIVDKDDRYSLTGGPFGSDLKSSDYTREGVRIIQLQNIGDGEFRNKDSIYTSKLKAQELFSCQIFPDDIIMSKMGDPVGRACLIPNIEDKFIMCSDGIRVKIDRNSFDNKFIFYSINHPYFRKSIERIALGSTRKRVGLVELKTLTLKIPPVKEQKKIAKILSTLDQAIEATQKLIAKEKNIKKGLMHDLLTNGIDQNGKIRSPQTHKYKESELGLIPEGWKVDILGNIVKIVGGGTPARNIDEYWENGTIPWVTVKDLHNKLYITNSEEKITLSSIDHSATNLIKANNVITSTRMGIGRFFINTVDITINQDLKALIPKKGIDTIFLLWNLLYHGKKLEALGTGTTVKGILLSDLKTLKLLLPSSQEQQKIANILTTQDKKIETEEKNLAKLKELKKGLMNDLLSGKVRVKQ